MTDLYDELEKKAGDKVGEKVRDLGGDLYDEAGIKSGDDSLISSQMKQQNINEERKRLFDELNQEMDVFERFMVGAGRGLTTIGRAFGAADPEDPATTQAFKQLSEESTAASIGEIVGEAAPFLAAAPLAGAGLATGAGRVLIPAAERVGMRVLGGAGLGATEGGAIAAGKGGTAGDVAVGAGLGGAIGGAGEAVLSVLGRLGSSLMQRLGMRAETAALTAEGTPTPELQQALDESGISFDDLAAEATRQAQQGASPAQVARTQRFEALEIPSTRGDLTQATSDQAFEQRLLSRVGSEASEPLRQLKGEQARAFSDRVGSLIDNLGVPAEAGETMKRALTGRRNLLRQEKNALYREAAEQAPEVMNIPLMTGSIRDALPSPVEMRRLSRIQGSQAPAVRELLVEFGIDQTPEAVEAFTEAGGEVIPLTLGTFEEFRQALNTIQRSDTTGSTSVITRPILEALDAEAGILDDQLADVVRDSPIDQSVIQTLRDARSRVRQLKTEFSPQSIVGQLVDVKRDGVTPVIQASQALRKVASRNTPIENLESTLASLRQSGDEGARAIQDMQSAIVLNALEDSFRAVGNKIDGERMISPVQFVKALENIGDDKLNLLFSDNPAGLNRLNALRQTAEDIIPPNVATPKGSAPVILDVLDRIGRAPGIAAVRDAVRFIVDAGADERAVRRAMSRPEYRRALTALQTDFPSLAVALGVPAVTKEEE